MVTLRARTHSKNYFYVLGSEVAESLVKWTDLLSLKTSRRSAGPMKGALFQETINYDIR